MRVPGIGPRPCRVAFFAEAPGQEEDLRGAPMVGKAGVEFSRFLNGYHLPLREDVFISNVVKERPPNNRDPLPDEIERDEPELLVELAEVRPEVIVALGRVSARYFLGDVDVELTHGFAYPCANAKIAEVFEDAPPPVFVSYHPAAGLHAPELMARFVYDMDRLAAFLKGTLPKPIKDQWVGREQYKLGLPSPCALTRVVAIDTEGLPGKPWGLSISDMPGEAYVVKAGQGGLIARLREALRGD